MTVEINYLHANFLEKSQQGLLILGAPNSGKTLLSYWLIQHHGYKLIADDLVKITIKHKQVMGQLVNVEYQGLLHNKKLGLQQVKSSVLLCAEIKKVITLNPLTDKQRQFMQVYNELILT